MNYLEGVPFKSPLGSLAEPLEVDPVTAPEITVPDYLQILRSTEVSPPELVRIAFPLAVKHERRELGMCQLSLFL